MCNQRLWPIVCVATAVFGGGKSSRADDITLPPLPVLKEGAVGRVISRVSYTLTSALFGADAGDSVPTQEAKNINPSFGLRGSGEYVNFVPTSICFSDILTPLNSLLIPFLSVMLLSDAGGYHDLPAGVTVSDPSWYFPRTGIEVTLSVQPISNLDTDVPHTLISPTSHIMLDWDFSAIPAEERVGRYFLVSGYAPYQAIVPGTGLGLTGAVMVSTLVLTRPRRRR